MVGSVPSPSPKTQLDFTTTRTSHPYLSANALKVSSICPAWDPPASTMVAVGCAGAESSSQYTTSSVPGSSPCSWPQSSRAYWGRYCLASSTGGKTSASGGGPERKCTAAPG